MKFIADDAFWKIFPKANLAVLCIENVRGNSSADPKKTEELTKLLSGANLAAKKYLVSHVISENPVVAYWRSAYSRFPTKKGARCSIEALLKRVLHNNPVSNISPIVDITNSISLKYAFPIGAEDLDTFAGDLHLGIAKGDESFLPLGSEKEEPPLPGEVIYYDEKGAVCRCWNWRDGVRTCVTDATVREFIIMEIPDDTRKEELKDALAELQDLLVDCLGVNVLSSGILDKDHMEISLL